METPSHTLSAERVAEAGEFLLDLRTRRAVVEAFPDHLAPTSVDDAYRIQEAYHAAAGWTTPVAKVGATSQIARDILQIPHPIAGRIPTECRWDSGATIDRSSFAFPPMVECEVAVRVTAAGEIDAVAGAIELVNPRIGLGPPHGITTIADNSSGCGVVIGDSLELDQLGPLSACDIRLTCDGETIAEGNGANVIGGAQGSVDWMLDHERSLGREPWAGLWIITGTCTGLTPTAWGQTYTATFGDVTEVSFRTT